MKEMACVKCQWRGDSHRVIVGDDGSQWCPKCHDKVVSVRELRDIRIEEKLDKIIALSEGKKLNTSKAFICPMCKGRKQVDLDKVGLWSPGDADRYGDCPLCDGDGFVVKKIKENN